MSAFLVAFVKVTDDGWVPAYAAEVGDLVAKLGGWYLSRSANIRVAEGDDRDLTGIALIQFPDTASAESFVADPAYAPHAEARRAGSISRFFIIDDTDVLGALPYLPKG